MILEKVPYLPTCAFGTCIWGDNYSVSANTDRVITFNVDTTGKAQFIPIIDAEGVNAYVEGITSTTVSVKLSNTTSTGRTGHCLLLMI